jgi:YggT family protein
MQALVFLLRTVAGFFTFLLLARFLMQWARASFHNPLGQFVIALTNWLVLPLRRVVPPLRGLDLASVVGAFLLQCLLVVALVLLTAGPATLLRGWLGVLLFAAQGFAISAIYLLFFVVIVDAVLSWVNPHAPMALPIRQLAAPILAPVRRFLPPISGFDLSPLVVLVVLQMLLMLLQQ